MFGLIRLIVFVLVAFAAGLLYAKVQAASDCRAAGGEMVTGVCRGVSR